MVYAKRLLQTDTVWEVKLKAVLPNSSLSKQMVEWVNIHLQYIKCQVFNELFGTVTNYGEKVELGRVKDSMNYIDMNWCEHQNQTFTLHITLYVHLVNILNNYIVSRAFRK